MDFPIDHLMDEDVCYHWLLDLLHPEGLVCPRCASAAHTVHRHRRGSPVVDYRCAACDRFFNLYTGTPWRGTNKAPSTIILILRGIAQGTSTAQLARELGLSRPHLLELRHQIQGRAAEAADDSPLPDDQAEADEMYQNAGEKRGSAHRPRRSATAAGQPNQGPRHLGNRSSSGPRSGRTEERSSPVPSRPAEHLVRVGRRHGAACHRAGDHGVHR